MFLYFPVKQEKAKVIQKILRVRCDRRFYNPLDPRLTIIQTDYYSYHIKIRKKRSRFKRNSSIFVESLFSIFPLREKEEFFELCSGFPQKARILSPSLSFKIRVFLTMQVPFTIYRTNPHRFCSCKSIQENPEALIITVGYRV